MGCQDIKSTLLNGLLKYDYYLAYDLLIRWEEKSNQMRC